LGTRVQISCDELRRRYLELGQTARQIGDAYGCSASTIVRRLDGCGIPRRGGRYRAGTVDEALLRQLYLGDRLPLRAIAERFGVSAATIGARLRAAGVPKRQPIVDGGRLRALWGLGLSVEVVARLSGSSAGAVVYAIQHLEQRGLPPSLLALPVERKAYLCGLRRSWLQAVRADDGSESVLVYRAAEQLSDRQLFVEAFGAGVRLRRVRLGAGREVLVAALPPSWNFLLAAADYVPNWVRAAPPLLLAFFAALVDAAGQQDADGRALLVSAPAPTMLYQLGEDLMGYGVSWQLMPDQGMARLRLSGAGLPRLLALLAPLRLVRA
jgi:hypothetical protein